MSSIPHSRTISYPRARAVPRRKGASGASVARFFAWVFAAMVVMHLAAGFFGQVLIEGARRAAIHAEVRASKASLEATELRRQLDNMQSAGRVSQWAQLNGFVSPYGGD